MLLDLPMTDLSFSSEQRSPAPASVNGVLSDGASFALVLNGGQAAKLHAAPNVQSDGVTEAAKRTLPAVSVAPAQLTFGDTVLNASSRAHPSPASPATHSQTLGGPASKIATPAQKPPEKPPIAPHISRTISGSALPHSAQSLPEDGNVMPEQIVSELPRLAQAPSSDETRPLQERASLVPDELPRTPSHLPAKPSTTVRFHVGNSSAEQSVTAAQPTAPTISNARSSDFPPEAPHGFDASKASAPPSIGLATGLDKVQSVAEPAAPMPQSSMGVQQDDLQSAGARASEAEAIESSSQSANAEIVAAPLLSAAELLPAAPKEPLESRAPARPLQHSPNASEKRVRSIPVGLNREMKIPPELDRPVLDRDAGETPQNPALKPARAASPRPVAQTASPAASVAAHPSPKIAIDPNALALPVEKPVSGTALSAPIPAPTFSNLQTPTPGLLPIGLPHVDASNTLSNTPSNTAPAAPQLRDAQPLERLVETISQMRESGQIGRGEVSLRHNQFGLVSMQVQTSEGDLHARLASRDPGFIAAAQMALTERAVTATSEANQTSSRGNDGGQNGQQHNQNQGRDMGGAAQDDPRQRGAASNNQHSDDAPTKGEHGAVLSSADDHTPSKDVSINQAAKGLFA